MERPRRPSHSAGPGRVPRRGRADKRPGGERRPDRQGPPRRPLPDPRPGPSLGRILFHLLQEYARHTGHLDIARELIDGETGE
ncbi:DUF664 domain-containing protein [Actinomadura geliboluensis]|uniref:mycothiol transferase n=1 Tax=Actinomadura geliboluensis TaxID=882440 RepID=UPI0036913EFB